MEVTLLSSWTETSVLDEAYEFCTNTNISREFIDTSSQIIVASGKSVGNSYKSHWEHVVEVGNIVMAYDLEKRNLFEMCLASRFYSPKIASQRQPVKEKTEGLANAGIFLDLFSSGPVKNIVERHDMFMQTFVELDQGNYVFSPDDLEGSFLMLSRKEVNDFESGCIENVNHGYKVHNMTLYGRLGNLSTAIFHVAIQGLLAKYPQRLRYTFQSTFLGDLVSDERDAHVSLQNFGAAMTIKSTEYRAVDESTRNVTMGNDRTGNVTNIACGIELDVLFKRFPQFFSLIF